MKTLIALMLFVSVAAGQVAHRDTLGNEVKLDSTVRSDSKHWHDGMESTDMIVPSGYYTDSTWNKIMKRFWGGMTSMAVAEIDSTGNRESGMERTTEVKPSEIVVTGGRWLTQEEITERYSPVNYWTTEHLKSKPSVHVFLELYTRYESECWADSTARQVGRGDAIVYPVNPPIIKYDYYEIVWTHREPTFKGFIEYLRRQK